MESPERKKKKLTPNQAKSRAENYCAYQERAQQEVRNKLYDWGLHTSEVEEIIVDLIENNFLNEERFAFAYTQGKFKMKGWGHYKLKQGLQSKNVSPRLIKEALASIDREEYFNKLSEILEKKEKSISEKDVFKKKQKLAQFGIYRGFESHLVWEIVHSLIDEN